MIEIIFRLLYIKEESSFWAFSAGRSLASGTADKSTAWTKESNHVHWGEERRIHPGKNPFPVQYAIGNRETTMPEFFLFQVSPSRILPPFLKKKWILRNLPGSLKYISPPFVKVFSSTSLRFPPVWRIWQTMYKPVTHSFKLKHNIQEVMS